MAAPDAAPNATLDDETPPPKKKRSKLFVGLSCLGVVFVCCVSSCGLFWIGASRHHSDVVRFTPPPRTNPALEPDPDWRLVAEARRAAPSLECTDVTHALQASLATREVSELRAFHEWLRARLAEADVQGIRDACEAVYAGGCVDPKFLDFRAGLVTLGRAAFERALREPDSLASVLAPEPACNELTWAVLAVMRGRAAAMNQRTIEPATPADAQVDRADARAGEDGRAPDEPDPLEPRTRTHDRDRLDLPATVPAICERYSCAPSDAFDELNFD